MRITIMGSIGNFVLILSHLQILIGTHLRKPFFLLAESTNEIEFIDYLNQLKTQVKEEYANKSPKPIILLDNHSAHRTAKSMKVLD